MENTFYILKELGIEKEEGMQSFSKYLRPALLRVTDPTHAETQFVVGMSVCATFVMKAYSILSLITIKSAPACWQKIRERFHVAVVVDKK